MDETKRQRLLDAIGTLPDEALSWLALACAPKAMLHGAHAQIWPDGIGGFTRESRAAIDRVREAAASCFDQPRGLK